ncbi:hypothetical protein XELAEV_18034445mg [Xenopus laevis]|uniref:Uncharacterized protein n=1 Tax=Xenopus laevis TaxID=8355 RepID=A0A974CEY8_XENLA|nr:hypothetical protein XELAEV_18034445mg [Xenopus laevis]
MDIMGLGLQILCGSDPWGDYIINRTFRAHFGVSLQSRRMPTQKLADKGLYAHQPAHSGLCHIKMLNQFIVGAIIVIR